MNGGKRGGKPHPYRRPPQTPDPRVKSPQTDDVSEASKLHQKPCKFWKFGKCNWGWGCRFLHGNSQADDPRRPEYRGAAIDFTQFPRPIASSPHFNMASPLHVDDQSRMKSLRNPVVEIVISNEYSTDLAIQLRETFLRSSIDVLLTDAIMMLSSNAAKDRFQAHNSDFMLYIDQSHIVAFPDSVPVTQSNVVDYIHRQWNIMNNNLTIEQIELLTPTELEAIITKLTTLEKIAPTVSQLQNEVSDAIASMSSNDCKFKPQALSQLRSKLIAFFGKLNLANSIIADLPIYSSAQPFSGNLMQGAPPTPNGLSLPVQKALGFILGQGLTQIHMCIAHVNKMMGEYTFNTTCFAMAKENAIGLHPTPLCAIDCASICTEETKQQFNQGRRAVNIEPDVSVEIRTPYQISFRDGMGMDSNVFNPFSRPPQRR